MTIVCLYTKLAAYFFKSLQYLLEHNPEVNVVIIRYQPSPNAPFIFEEENRLEIINKDDYKSIDLIDKVRKMVPDIIYVSGWIDRDYKRICSIFIEKKVPVIMGLDNIWTGSIKQYLKAFLSRRSFHKWVSHVWIAGTRQYEFARILGYPDDRILKGIYCADIESFSEAGRQQLVQKRVQFPRSIIFIGRLVPYKQPLKLAQSFDRLADKAEDWELIFVGAGPLKKEIEALNNSRIRLMDFIQPDQLPALLAGHGIFCLPSNGEHWGVVVQEAAAAGLPLLVSNKCGAASEFLVQGFNGLMFDLDRPDHLGIQLEKMLGMGTEELIQMSENSMKIAGRINHELWMHTLLSVIT